MVEGGPHTPLPFNSSTIVSGMTDESLVNAGLEFIFEQGGGGWPGPRDDWDWQLVVVNNCTYVVHILSTN